jgi:tetratricopeptide (TPR) repeat protein
MQLAKVYDQADAVVDRLDALMRASACDPEDASLAAEVGSAVSIAEKVKLRLTHQGWTEPKNDEETEVVVRAGVLAKYGFPDRAKVVLEASNGIRQTVSVRAMMAEVLAQLDDVAGAIAEMDAIESDEDAAKVDIATRMLVLRGDFSSLGAGVAVAVEMDVEVEDEDEEMSIEMDDEQEEYGGIEDAALDEAPSPVAKVHDEREAEGDRLAAAGDSAGAISAYQAALDADPTNEAVLMKLGEIFAAADSTAIKAVPMEALTPISNDPGGFEAAPASPSAPVVQLDPGYLGLRGLVMLGELDKAYGLAEERDDLLGACIMAKVYALRGEAKKARRVLQESMDEVDEDANGYSEGLWGLALIAAMLGKARTAARLLGELERLVPGHRSQDIEALRAGLKR